MKVNNLKNKKILILGLGKDGSSTLEYLKKHLPDQKFSVSDKTEKELDLNFLDQTFFGDEYLKHLTEFDVIIKTAGISSYLPEIVNAKENGIIITSSTAIFFCEFSGQIIGVTGTKGKSTTSSLIYQILKTANLKTEFIGNIGKPCLDFLDQIDTETKIVFELSSYQLDNLSKSPHIAVFTNIYPEHLDWHQNFENYFKAKSNITLFQTEDDFFVYNSDFSEFRELAKKTKANKIPFSKDSFIGDIKSELLGDFNLLNITAAMIVAQLLGVENEIIEKAISQFKPLPHRLEKFAEKNGITFYNDSLSTIPQATVAALDALGDDVETLIAGGFDRGVSYEPIGQRIAQSKIKNLILFPDTGNNIWQSVLKNTNIPPRKFDVNNMKEAVKLAFENTSPGKICLLSPASTSFNMFKDYVDRGNQFKEEIKNY